MRGRARREAEVAFARAVDAFARLGYAAAGPRDVLGTRLEGPGLVPLTLALRADGRIFGGSFALEVATADPVLPASGGLRGRPHGVVTLAGVAFRPRRGDSAGAELARRLSADSALAAALAGLHFERLRVEPDGRPVIRHMGGSVVWVLFPPLARSVPLVAEQARASVRALEAFAAVGRPDAASAAR